VVVRIGMWRLMASVMVALVATSGAAAGVLPVAAKALARADSLLGAGHVDAARAEYTAVLQVDPEQSRAIFQLGRLAIDDVEAERMFRRYVGLEPEDAWGHMALGDLLGRMGHRGEAIDCYNEALRLAPGERDAAIGRARCFARAGRTDAAIAAYDAWLVTHPQDAEAWRELGRARRKAGRPRDAAAAFEKAIASGDHRAVSGLEAARREAAPALEPFVSGSGDSDGNGLMRAGLAADMVLSGTVRAGVRASRARIDDPAGTRTSDDLGLEVAWRPLAALRIRAASGAMRIPRADPATGDEWVPTGRIRAGWRAAVSGAVEVSVARELLVSSPLLVESRVLRTEALGRGELPLWGGLRLRGSGRFATLASRTDTNRRQALQGGLALALLPQLELNATALDLRYDHPSADGYFAPDQAQLVECGAYLETEAFEFLSLALDAGVGAQRVVAYAAGPGNWQPALRLWAQLGFGLGAGCRLNLEFDGYDAPSAAEAATSSGWRYGFAAVSLRVPIP
jgi:tetratricopeptide (TPR) repeat protein